MEDTQLQSSHNVPNNTKIGIGLDACLIPTRFENYSIIQTVDFFYPLVDDPYLMGKIACANVLSDLYAFGIYQIDKTQMIVSICDQFSEKECSVITPLMFKGFQDAAQLGGVKVVLQNCSYNPWCIIGGVATSLCTENEYIHPLNAQIGDVLILTKPLGVQMACNILRWCENPQKWETIMKTLTKEEALESYHIAVRNMCRLNKTAAYLMHKYDAHAATDVTGFGILGHAENLVQYQTHDIMFIIHTLPFIKNIIKVAEALGTKTRLLNGRVPETSGGLLISLPKENVDNFCRDMREYENCDAWVIGNVVAGSKTVHIIDNVKIVEVN